MRIRVLLSLLGILHACTHTTVGNRREVFSHSEEKLYGYDGVEIDRQVEIAIVSANSEVTERCLSILDSGEPAGNLVDDIVAGAFFLRDRGIIRVHTLATAFGLSRDDFEIAMRSTAAGNGLTGTVTHGGSVMEEEIRSILRNSEKYYMLLLLENSDIGSWYKRVSRILKDGGSILSFLRGRYGEVVNVALESWDRMGQSNFHLSARYASENLDTSVFVKREREGQIFEVAARVQERNGERTFGLARIVLHEVFGGEVSPSNAIRTALEQPRSVEEKIIELTQYHAWTDRANSVEEVNRCLTTRKIEFRFILATLSSAIEKMIRGIISTEGGPYGGESEGGEIGEGEEAVE